MATWFPIWAPHREPSCKNVLAVFQVATSAASVESPKQEYHIIEVLSNYYDDVLVCVHVPCHHVRCKRHVRGAISGVS